MIKFNRHCEDCDSDDSEGGYTVTVKMEDVFKTNACMG